MNTWRRGCLKAAVVCSFFILCAEAGSQEQLASPFPLTVGSRIRLLAPTVVTGRIEGMVIQLDGRSMLVGANGRTPVSVPHQAITRLEVSTGRRGHALLGLGIGAAVGAGLGAALGSTGCVPAVGCGQSYSGGAAAVGAVGGAAWGAGIGALIRTDRWSAVPLERLRLSLGPIRGGLRISLAVDF
jgi:hypothetical protein